MRNEPKVGTKAPPRKGSTGGGLNDLSRAKKAEPAPKTKSPGVDYLRNPGGVIKRREKEAGMNCGGKVKRGK